MATPIRSSSRRLPSLAAGCFLLGLLAAPLSSQAADYTWVPETSGLWDDPANWGGIAPTSGDLAIINNGGTALLPADVSGFYSVLQVGTTSGGSGSVHITGGNLEGVSSVLGNAAGSSGTALVTDGTWNNTFLIVGQHGTGSLTISGGVVSARSSTIARQAGGHGTVLVTGGIWNLATSLSVGLTGEGFLTIEGGLISSNQGSIGGSNGTVLVTGGTWSNGNELVLGGGSTGAGTLTISGGLVSAHVLRGTFGTSTITVTGTEGDRGMLSTGLISKGPGPMTLTVDGGVLQAREDRVNFLENFAPGAVIFGADGAFFDTQDFTVGIAAALGGAGGLTKQGTGTLILNGSNTYAGATEVSAGTFVVNGSLATSAVTMGDGTTLSGGGSIAGDVTLGGNVTINPGNGVGTLTMGSLALNATSVLNFDLGTPAFSDRIVVNGDLTLDGTLNIADLIGFGAGTYRLFDYTGSLTDNGLLFGITPGAFDLTLSTSTTNEINLLVTAAAAQYWDGPNATPQGNPGGSGGTGAWDASTTNWTNASGNANTDWDGTLGAVFAGAAGTVTIADGFTATAPALTFATDGYTLAAAGTGVLEMTAGAVISVQTGTTTIEAPITGSAETIVKQGGGTLSLTGTNTYTGATWVRDGVLDLAGSISHAASDFAVGRHFGDDASLLIRDGATLTNHIGFLGVDGGSTGTATLLGGTWTNADELRIGEFGNGHLIVEAGEISSTIGNIARSVGSTGTVTMNGGTWTNSNLFVVGNAGVGTLTFNDGTIESVTSTIGLNSGGTGTATMNAGNWNNTGELRIGDLGEGTLTINGGVITSTIGNIARGIGSTGTVNMIDGVWTADSLFVVGNEGEGVFNQTGGQVTNVDGEIGRNVGGVGTATLTGGTWTNSGGLVIGKAGIGTLNLLAGGNLEVGGGTIIIAAESGSEGTLNFGSPDLDNPTSVGNLTASALVFGSGEGVIQFNQNDTLSFGVSISGEGTVIQRGSGTTTLTGAHTYTGETLVSAGTLLVNGSLTASTVRVADGGILGGTGSIDEILLEAGATLAAGNSIGTLAAGSLTWEAGAGMVYELGNGTADLVSLSGELTMQGIGDFLFTFVDVDWQVGQTYTLMEFDSTNFNEGDFGFTNLNGFDGFFALHSNSLDFTLTAIPEPATLSLLTLCLSGFVLDRLRRKHSA